MNCVAIIIYLYVTLCELSFQEWKIINAYSVRVRHKNNLTDRYSKMSLQLYQVDYKSYLLDFKSLSSEEDDIGRGKLFNTKLLRLYKYNLCIQNICMLLDPTLPPPQATGHHTMEFFEMCAALITQLAR